MTLARRSLTDSLRTMIADAVASSTQPGAAAIRGELAGTTLEVPVPPTITVARNQVLAPVAAHSRFAILVHGLTQHNTLAAGRLIDDLVALSAAPHPGDDHESMSPEQTDEQDPQPFTVGFWNVDRGTLDPGNANDRPLAALKCASVRELLTHTSVLGVTDLEPTVRGARRVGVNRGRWSALASASGAVLLRSAPGLPADRAQHRVGVLVRAEHLNSVDVVGGGRTEGSGEWLAVRVGGRVAAVIYEQEGNVESVAAVFRTVDDMAGGAPVVIGGDLDLRGLPGGRADTSGYGSIHALHRHTDYRALTSEASGHGDWTPTWRFDHRTGAPMSGGSNGEPIQIDHILVRPDQHASAKLRVPALRGSDHRPVVASL